MREADESAVQISKRGLTRSEAEDLVYQSYMQAAAGHAYNERDSRKRHPKLTKNMIRQLHARYQTPGIVVTGSKGKGSVAVMLSQILQLEMRTGLMTSPHQLNFCERFKVNGVDISDEMFAAQMTVLQPHIDKIQNTLMPGQFISPMGIQAALALQYFGEQETQINVFECGKGARYDDVTQIPHEYAVINRIFLEHTRELGDTLEAIAEDKAHVIDDTGRKVYVAQQEPEVLQVLRRRAEAYQVPLKIYGVDFRAENIRYTTKGMIFDTITAEHAYCGLRLPLLGEHQAKNCSMAIALCEDMLGGLDAGRLSGQLDHLVWPGRMEILCRDPFVLLDACIHRSSAGEVKKVIEYLQLKKLTVIIGIPDDKDYLGVAQAMSGPEVEMILTRSSNPHYRFSDEQQRVLKQYGIHARLTKTVQEALQCAEKLGHAAVILGTTSVVAEIRNLLVKRPASEEF